MREYLDPVIKADQCAQYVDDMGLVANLPEQLITRNIRAFLECIQSAGIKLSMAKCKFEKKVDFLVETITLNGVTPQKQKTSKISDKVKFLRSKKPLQRFLLLPELMPA